MNTTLLEKYQHYFTPNYLPHGINLVKGEGSVLVDENGKKYIDLAGGIAVSALGHHHPVLVKTLHEAVDSVWHLSNYWLNSPAIELAEYLCESTFAENVFFANSGAEANEAALKLARLRSFNIFGEGKKTIVSFTNGFHGRTLFTASVTGQKKYCETFAPLPGGIIHHPFNSIENLEKVIDKNCCAVIVEPIQGEGGVTAAEKPFLQKLRQLCDEQNALLIFDEIQTGAGRTGSLFAYQQPGIIPDILTSAKALGCGLPIGAMLTTKEIGKHLTPGTHGSTFGGNPFVTRVALAALKEINTPAFLDEVMALSNQAETRLKEINNKLHCFSDIRCYGLLTGCDLSADWLAYSQQIQQTAMSLGVLVLPSAGGSVLRLAPPLNIPKTDLDKGLDLLTRALEEISENIQQPVETK